MASIIGRGLDDHVKQQLASQAKEHGRSKEGEVRAILTKAARQQPIGLALLIVGWDQMGVVASLGYRGLDGPRGLDDLLHGHSGRVLYEP